jgi:hypothetical protein
MDQGVLEALEKKYHCKLRKSLIKTTDDGDDMLATLKKITLTLWFIGSHNHGKKLK